MNPNPPLPPDDDIDAALRAGLRSPSLSAEALQRVRAVVENEWQAAVTAPTARSASAAKPVWRWLAAAALAAIAVSASWLAALNFREPSGVVTLATLVRAEAPGARWRRAVLADRPLSIGAPVQTGQQLEFSGAALLALRDGATLRVAAGTSIAVLDAARLRLERGEVYVDVPASAVRSLGSLAIVTDDGEFRHLGTQFAVARLADGTRLRVREGRVSWQSGAALEIGEEGTQMAIRGGQIQAREALATSGVDWQWVEALAPEFAIENRTLIEFLRWVARETGRKLQFADSEARAQAAAIVLHGNVRGLPPQQALAQVMATTRLQHGLSAGSIRVSLPREEPSPPR